MRRLFSLLLAISICLVACKEEPGVDPEPEPTNNNPYGISYEEIAAIDPGSSVTVDGDLSDGLTLPELDWAALSNVACFPATRFIEFQGKQKFYSVDIPQGSELVVTVTPTGTKERINVWGYIDFDGKNLPPLTSVTSCEAGYELYVGNPDLTKEGEPQDISFAQAVNRGFTAFIAVSGANGVESGTYSLEFALQ